jgi:hypothetical protein
LPEKPSFSKFFSEFEVFKGFVTVNEHLEERKSDNFGFLRRKVPVFSAFDS